MDPFNLTNQQYHILRILQKLHPKSASINVLKENMIDKMSDVSRIVDRLLQKDLLVRSVSNKDRRSVDITITDKGLELIKEINLDNSIRSMLESNLTPEEAGELSRLLDKFRG
jgi:DNA-binding MarR family transcriptional regulator